ncbi:MAG: hypothetical protein Q8K22_14865 [Rhodoferax sp.]|jgi:hypothetical protein|nr:hypothetical protein [Rhodoferax sp.]
MFQLRVVKGLVGPPGAIIKPAPKSYTQLLGKWIQKNRLNKSVISHLASAGAFPAYLNHDLLPI